MKFLVYVALLTVVVFSLGCSSTRNVTLKPYTLGNESMIRLAPETGVYKIEWLENNKTKPKTLAGSNRLIPKGQLIGFATEPNGQLVAIAGFERFPLNTLPANAHYFQWQGKYAKESQALKNYKAGTRALGNVLSIIAALPILAADAVLMDSDILVEVIEEVLSSGSHGTQGHTHKK